MLDSRLTRTGHPSRIGNLKLLGPRPTIPRLEPGTLSSPQSRDLFFPQAETADKIRQGPVCRLARPPVSRFAQGVSSEQSLVNGNECLGLDFASQKNQRMASCHAFFFRCFKKDLRTAPNFYSRRGGTEPHSPSQKVMCSRRPTTPVMSNYSLIQRQRVNRARLEKPQIVEEYLD